MPYLKVLPCYLPGRTKENHIEACLDSQYSGHDFNHVLRYTHSKCYHLSLDRLCGLVVRVLGYRSGGPGSIPGTTRKRKKSSFSLVSTTEELLDRKVAVPV
jgi:hypothetical protein